MQRVSHHQTMYKTTIRNQLVGVLIVLAATGVAGLQCLTLTAITENSNELQNINHKLLLIRKQMSIK